jgi:hypothetical protein
MINFLGCSALPQRCCEGTAASKPRSLPAAFPHPASKLSVPSASLKTGVCSDNEPKGEGQDGTG